MSARSFFDTNVLVYADDRRNLAKQRRALELIGNHRKDRSGVVSVQVLQEYFVTATRKLGVNAADARRKVELLAHFDVFHPGVSDVLAAIDLHRLHNLSFWDALIFHSAKQSGCTFILSENMHDALRIGGVQIVNPFV